MQDYVTMLHNPEKTYTVQENNQLIKILPKDLMFRKIINLLHF